MTKYELIKEMSNNIEIRWIGHGSWRVDCSMPFPVKNGEPDIIMECSMITHDEEDKTGIFDGKTYNPLAGYNTIDEVDEVARQECMTTQTYLETIWSDTANECNYEPKDERDYRLAVRLYEDVLRERSEYQDIDVEE